MPGCHVSTDALDEAVRGLADLEARGIHLRAGGGRVSFIGDADQLSEDDRNWIGERQRDLQELLDVRPIDPLGECPGPDRLFDLTAPQLGLWSGASHPDPRAFAAVSTTNQAIRLRCLGLIDIRAVARAFRRVVLKHPALRARLERSAPKVGFHPVDEMQVGYRDILGLKEAAVLQLLDEEEQAPFEFFGGKLSRATLYRWAENRHLLQIVCNHIIIDGWSAPIVTRDFIAAYNAGPGDDAPWRDRGRLYFGYLDWEQSTRQKARRRLAALRWRRWLSEAPSRPVSARVDEPRTGDHEICDAVHNVDLDPEIMPRLCDAAPKLGATAGNIVIAAIMLLLVEESECDTPVALMLDSGRWRPEQAELCSFFATPLPIAMRVRHDESS